MTPTITLSLEDFDNMRNRIKNLEEEMRAVEEKAREDFWVRLRDHLFMSTCHLRGRHLHTTFNTERSQMDGVKWRRGIFPSVDGNMERVVTFIMPITDDEIMTWGKVSRGDMK